MQLSKVGNRTYNPLIAAKAIRNPPVIEAIAFSRGFTYVKTLSTEN